MFGTVVCLLQYKDWYCGLHRTLFCGRWVLSLIIGRIYSLRFLGEWGWGYDYFTCRNYRQMGLPGNLIDIEAFFSDIRQSCWVMRRGNYRRVTGKKGRRIKGAIGGGKVGGCPRA